MTGTGGGDPEIIAAAWAGDTDRVLALLETGADPNTVGADGLSLLDVVAAEGLTRVAARLVRLRFDFERPATDLDRRAPDGWTPLLRAVDAGAYGVVDELLGHDASTAATTPDGRTAIELARHWHETGAENELRRRTGATGPAELLRVEEAHYCSTGLLSLGGARVRTGHGAILTLLELMEGIETPFEELLARADAEPDVEHAVRWAATLVLGMRPGPDTWAAAAALRDRPRASVRHFGASVLQTLALLCDCGGCGSGFGSSPDCLEQPTAELFFDWAAGERDPEVLAVLLVGLAQSADVAQNRAVFETALPHHAHPTASVRRAVAQALARAPEEETARARAVLLGYTRDADADVRILACCGLSALKDRSVEVRDALALLWDDPALTVRQWAALTLVLLDDPRGEAAMNRLTEGWDEETRRYGMFADAVAHLERREREGGRDPETAPETAPDTGRDTGRAPDPSLRPDPDPAPAPALAERS